MSSITERGHRGSDETVGLDSSGAANQMHSSRTKAASRTKTRTERASKQNRRPTLAADASVPFNKGIKMSPFFPFLEKRRKFKPARLTSWWGGARIWQHSSLSVIIVRGAQQEQPEKKSGSRKMRTLRFHRVLFILCSMALGQVFPSSSGDKKSSRVPKRPFAGHTSSH